MHYTKCQIYLLWINNSIFLKHPSIKVKVIPNQFNTSPPHLSHFSFSFFFLKPNTNTRRRKNLTLITAKVLSDPIFGEVSSNH